jgi:membrane protein implicated in regulation of membrane protease activity
MNTSTRRAAVTAAASVAMTAVAVAAPSLDAAAAARPRSHITVHPSDTSVAAGQQFVLRGRLTRHGEPIENGRVRVAARYPDGDWDNLSGAVVATDSEGRYRVRVILSMAGHRDLRVVGDPPGDRVRSSRAYTTVRVTS